MLNRISDSQLSLATIGIIRRWGLRLRYSMGWQPCAVESILI
jgi:hypothetical protein